MLWASKDTLRSSDWLNGKVGLISLRYRKGELQCFLVWKVSCIQEFTTSAERGCLQNHKLFPYLLYPVKRMTRVNHYYFDPEPIIILLPFNKMNNWYYPFDKWSTMPYFILNLCLLVSSNKISFFQIFTKKEIGTLQNRKRI